MMIGKKHWKFDRFRFSSAIPVLWLKFLVLVLALNLGFRFSECCQINNRQMHVCLHRYLERDFSLVEELLKRPPYAENGHILLEETELEEMCRRLEEMKQCYERMLASCVSYAGYSHMIRLIGTFRAVYGDLCNPNTFYIKQLIEGGYCIEFVRHESGCSELIDKYGLTNPQQRVDPNSSTNSSDLVSTFVRPKPPPPQHQWPYTLTSMLRFETGVNMCPYLNEFNRCMIPYIERRCRSDSILIWNISMTDIIDNWCLSSFAISTASFSLLIYLIPITAVLLFGELQ